MKNQVKSEDDDSCGEFEVFEVKIIKTKTRARIMMWTLVLWLLVLLASAVVAISSADWSDLHKVVDTLTNFVAIGFGWYFRGRQAE